MPIIRNKVGIFVKIYRLLGKASVLKICTETYLLPVNHPCLSFVSTRVRQGWYKGG